MVEPTVIYKINNDLELWIYNTFGMQGLFTFDIAIAVITVVLILAILIRSR